MSDFSELLSRFIREKEIRVYPMVNYCGMDRSTMYKIINGKRNPPSPEIRDRMADFMHLTPEENQMFRHAYDISVTGREIYFHRKAVEEFLLNVPSVSELKDLHLSDISDNCPTPQKNTGLDDISCVPFSDRSSFHFYVQEILKDAAADKNGRIGLLLQPDCEFLFDYLTGLQISGCPFHIEHLICLNKADYIPGEKNFSFLKGLPRLLSLFINGINYEPYYFYDDLYSHYHNLNAFSSMILTEDYAILCTSDYKYGILHHDKPTVSMLWSLFDSYREKCRPLFSVPHNIIEECSMVTSVITQNPDFYVFEPEPCLVPFIDKAYMDRIVPAQAPGREFITETLRSYLDTSRSRVLNNDFHFYYCREELELFADTGILSELPETFGGFVFSVEERIAILENVVQNFSRIHFRFLKPPYSRAAARIRLCAGEASLYLQFSDVLNRRVYLFPQEPGLVLSLYDYLRSLGDEQLSSESEAKECMQQLLQRLRTAL